MEFGPVKKAIKGFLVFFAARRNETLAGSLLFSQNQYSSPFALTRDLNV